MKHFSSVVPVVGLFVALALPTLAQTVPSQDVETVKSGIGEEQLAPVAIKQPPIVRAGSPTMVTGGAAANTMAAAVSDSAPVATDPFLVKGVVATLSNTTGFDRDAALEVAARQALPGVLVSMGNTPEKAAKSLKGLGSVMRFVKGYKVVKESLLPVYTLTTDLTFNGAMIQKNFGGKMPVSEPVAKPSVVLAVSGTTVGTDSVEVDVPVAQNTPLKQWVVRIGDRDPEAVDRVRLNLLKQPGTKANYRLLTAAGAELVVDTPMTAADINRVAGHSVDVVELEIPLPTTVVPAGSGEHPWQGQAEPSAPASPNAPTVPGTPNAPEGTY